VNTDTLEAKIAETNTKLTAQKSVLDNMLIDTDAIDSSCNTIEAQSVLTASRLNNIQNKISANVDGTGDTLGQINSNILTKNGEIESSLNSLISANHTDLIALEGSLTSMELKQDDIKTAVELLDNALDGNYLNVNQNIAGVDISGNSGNKDDETQRVCLATDDIPIALVNTNLGTVNSSIGTGNATLVEIKTAVELLDNAIDGAYLNVNQNISGTDVASNSGNKNDQTQRVCLATDDVATGLTNSILNAVNGSIGTGNTALGAIKTAVELLDNALDGNYLNVNANIGGADFAVNSGNKDSATQRVVIATDDVPFGTLNTHLSEIEDAVETLQACVDSNKLKVQFEAGDLNIGNVDVASSALPSGASTESSLTAMSAKLPASLGAKADGASISTCRSSTQGAYDMTGRTTIGTASTTTNVLVDSAGHLQVDVLSGGGSTDVSGVATHAKQDSIISLIGTTNSGLSSIDSGISDLDTLLTDIEGGVLTDNKDLLTTIDSDTNNIKTATELVATAVDTNSSNATAVRSDVYFQGVASETNSGNKNDNVQRVVLATDDIPLATANAKLVEIETTANSILSKNTEIETTANSILSKNTEMETSLNSILSKNGEIESSMNSLISANHTDLVALEATLTEIAPRTAVATLSDATNLADGAATSIVDTDGYRYMTFFGKATNSFELTVQYSLTNSASKMISLYLQDMSSESVNDIETIHRVLEHPARYVRFINYNGDQANALTLYYQLSN